MNVEDKKPKFDKESIDSIVRYLNILTTTSCISRQIVTSEVKAERGLIDRLELHLSDDVSIENVIKKSKELGYVTRYKYLDKNKYFLIIQTDLGCIYCNIGYQGNTDFYKVHCNPSDFKHYSNLEKILIKLFGPSILNAKPYGIDLTVDYFEDLSTITQGLNISYKQNNVQYINERGRTGLRIGSGDDVITVYDKSLKESLSHFLTRIERRLRGRKFPIKYLKDLPSLVSFIEDPSKIRWMNTNTISFDSHACSSSDFEEVKVMVKHSGYLVARKTFNKNKNFQRDYGKFITLTPFKMQPLDILKRDIPAFFKGGFMSE